MSAESSESPTSTSNNNILFGWYLRIETFCLIISCLFIVLLKTFTTRDEIKKRKEHFMLKVVQFVKINETLFLFISSAVFWIAWVKSKLSGAWARPWVIFYDAAKLRSRMAWVQTLAHYITKQRPSRASQDGHEYGNFYSTFTQTWWVTKRIIFHSASLIWSLVWIGKLNC